MPLPTLTPKITGESSKIQRDNLADWIRNAPELNGVFILDIKRSADNREWEVSITDDKKAVGLSAANP